GCTFRNNLCETDDGGAIYGRSNSTGTFTDCDFMSNIAADDGGAVCLVNPNGYTFTRCEFAGNQCGGGEGGGAIGFDELSTSGLLTISNCIFTANGTAGTAMGGAIWADVAPLLTINITGSEFAGNQAIRGGAISVHRTTVTIGTSEFTANAGEFGGAVYASEVDLTVRGSRFLQNTALPFNDNDTCSGGALYCLNASLRGYDNVFVENEAEMTGGAVYFTGPIPTTFPGGTQDLINCLMVENTAGLSGGAVSVMNGAWPYMINCTMVGNMATDIGSFGGAVSCAYDSLSDGTNQHLMTDALLENCIVWDNLAEFGPQAALGDPLDDDSPFVTLEIAYTDIQGGLDNIFLGLPVGNTYAYSSGGMIDADPMFADVSVPTTAEERTFYLSQDFEGGQLDNSPCYNTGIGTLANLINIYGYNPITQNLTTRTDHGLDTNPIDMGYHYDASPAVEEYQLETMVSVADLSPHGRLVVTTDPNNLVKVIDRKTSHATYLFKQGAVVELKAEPYANYRVKAWTGADNAYLYNGKTNTATMDGYTLVTVEFELAVPRNLYVPESYDTIEDALMAAHDDDTIVLARRPATPYLIGNPNGINFGGKRVHLRSTDPNNPAIVAETIIDCQGSSYTSKRAFHFNSGEGSDSIIEGVTIQNAFTAVIGASRALNTGRWPWPFIDGPPDPLPPFRALSGMDGTGDSYGGAILCENGSSPMIRKCVFKNCTVSGGIGGDGADGNPPINPVLDEVDADIDAQSGGHSGKGTGNGYGGAIAVIDGSSPVISECQFINNQATGGRGGIPGDSGRAYNGGRYGWGGNDWAGINNASQYGINPQAGYGEGDGRGGAIYVDAGCDPTIADCIFKGNIARIGFVSPGGVESPNGGEYPEPWDSEVWGEEGMRDGRDGILTDNGEIAGGAVFFAEDAEGVLDKCKFSNSAAYDAYTDDDSPYPTRGGAIYTGSNVVLTIESCDITGSLAGALYCSQGVDLTLSRSLFEGNRSEDLTTNPGVAVSYPSTYDTHRLGGAVTLMGDAQNVWITDCRFNGNATSNGGGAIYTLSDIAVEDSLFNANSSQTNGGAIYSYYDLIPGTNTTLKLDFDNCEFSGNAATGLGGAAYIKTAIMNYIDCFFVSNVGYSGGGLYAVNSNV
ncbi:MAG: right-handed parallel beta-helix repeat-containing protein, partial [Planctomycetota bacterium]